MKSNMLFTWTIAYITLVTLFISSAAYAQQGNITTVAGAFPLGDGGPALEAALTSAGQLAFGPDGSLYIADVTRIRRLAPNGVLTTVLGSGVYGAAGDNGPALNAQISLSAATGLTTGSDGSIYFYNITNALLRKMTPAGRLVTIAGRGSDGVSGDGGLATAAEVGIVRGIAVDASGNVYLSDSNHHRIRKISSATGIITTVAGDGRAGFSGDGGPATEARLNTPRGLALDSAGNLYIADNGNNCVRRLAPDGAISTLAGSGATASDGDGGPAIAAALNDPYQLAIDTAGRLYVTEHFGSRVRRLEPDGTITTVAGSGVYGRAGDEGPATDAQLQYVNGVAVAPDGTIFLSHGQQVRAVDASGVIRLAAGVSASAGDLGTAYSARLVHPTDVAFDPSGNLYIASCSDRLVRRVDVSGQISVFAGNLDRADFLDGESATRIGISVCSVATDQAGNVYTADYNLVRISPDGMAQRMAFLDDGGSEGLAFDTAGNLITALPQRHSVVRITPDGVVTRIAGTGLAGSSGDGGPATEARLNTPRGVAVGSDGSVYIAEYNGQRIRRVTPDAKSTLSPGMEDVPPTSVPRRG